MAIAVVGQVAGQRTHVVAQTSEGDPVLLVPEPDNPHDPFAVAVYTAPAGALRHPVVFSADDDLGKFGFVHDEDRLLLMDRQAGYISRTLAARMMMPPTGMVGRVSQVRFTPDTKERIGFDVEVETVLL